MELSWSHICTGGLLQSTGTHLARAGWDTVVAPGQGEPEPNPELWETLAQGETWEIPERDQRIPTLGPGPALNMTDFVFRESLRKVLWGLFLLLFGVLGLCWWSILSFF